jgi:23S rRNA-/tRNA-specific pseudouridylate synthase
MTIVAPLIGHIGLWGWLFVIAYKNQNTIVSLDNIPKRCVVVIQLRSSCRQINHDSENATKKEELRCLVYRLGKAYDEKGIQGVLDACDDEESSLIATLATPTAARDDLFQNVLDAYPHHQHRGKKTGILNGIMGWCCYRSCQTGSETYARLCDNLYETYRDLQSWRADIVTMALAFTGVCDKFPDIARMILGHAKQLQKSHNKQQVPSTTVLYHPKENVVSTHRIEILHDDMDLLVLNKPSGMSLSEIQSILLQQGITLSNLNPDGSRGLVHRLDTGTSGCLVMAKSNAMHLKLVSQFFLRQVQKSYIALVFNLDDGVELPCSGIIDLPIDGRPAKSNYSILPPDGRGDGAILSVRVTKIRIKTQQGRKHQVRIQCSKGLNRPILLDPLYGGEKVMFWINSRAMKQARANKQFCLHADQLSLPTMGVHVSATIPFWWDQIVKDINKSGIL